MFILSWLLALNFLASADVNELSPKCAELAGDFDLKFHGQNWPFKMRTYHLRLTFLEGSSGVSFATDFGLRNVTQNFDTDTMLNSYRYDWPVLRLTVHDCFNQPFKCLESAAASLNLLTIARTYPAADTSNENKRALYCAVERVRLFNKTVRTEVLQPTLRALPRF